MKYPEILLRRKSRPWILAVLAVLAFAIAAVVLIMGRDDVIRRRATISVGPIVETRIGANLERLVHEAQKFHLELRPVGTESEIERLERVESGKLDFAFIHGGFDFSRFRNLRQITALNVQPLHLLVKEEQADAVAAHLSALRGKVVNLGSVGAGGYWLARDVLDFAGLHPGSKTVAGDYTESRESLAQMLAERDRDKLPDAIFFMSALPSQTVRDLVARHRYRLIALPFRDAYALGAITQDVQPGARPPEGGPEIRKENIVDATIPAFTYRVDPGIPPAPMHTLGMRVLLITGKTMDSRTVQRLLDTMLTTRIAKLIHPPLDVKRLEEVPELPLHPGVTRFLDRNKPFLTHELIDQVRYWFTVGASSLGGFVFVRKWFQQRNKKIENIGTFIKMAAEIERQALEQERSGSPDLAVLLDLDRELGRVKLEALNQILDAAPKDENRMPVFLAQFNDARAYLARLIKGCRDRAESSATVARSADGVS